MVIENSWYRCPGCKGMGKVDDEQVAGKVSIVCECGFHGYAKEGETVKLKAA
ncbi:hypothetical protein LCGC14_1608300 [marine sediment metagenome]|uniref:Uncharacterized protein n=1 Tax=marine sediment metagenome TaxID=412755 RepID=A0A0F9IVQ4_9ZZZZ